MFGTRASCHKFLANQFRLLLAALAYTLMQRLRALALTRTESAPAPLLRSPSAHGFSRLVWVCYAIPVASV